MTGLLPASIGGTHARALLGEGYLYKAGLQKNCLFQRWPQTQAIDTLALGPCIKSPSLTLVIPVLKGQR